MGVGALSERHPGWDICAVRAGGVVTWKARPQRPGQDVLAGWDAPGVLHADSAEALDALLAREAPPAAPRQRLAGDRAAPGVLGRRNA
jgi:hypothetical protein